MNLYQALLMDHYQHPRNYGTLNNPHFTSDEHNPSCGDTITVEGALHNNVLVAIKFVGKGCVISQSTASLLTERLQGTSVQDILHFDTQQLQTLIGLSLGPLRLKCALLPLHALKQGIRSYLTKEA